MRKLRVASVALLLVASTGLLFGSMGFSSVAADRGVSVAVADDDSALVGYETTDHTVTDDERIALLTVRNRLSSSASVTNVTADTTDSSIRVDDFEAPTAIGTGSEGTVYATVDCEAGTEATLTVSVTVEADGVTAAISGDTATRSFEVSCADLAAHDGPTFNGAGNFDFGATDDDAVNVTYWTASTEDGDLTITEYEADQIDPAKKLNGQVDNGSKFVAVYVHDWDTTYVHPGFDRANETIHWGTGKQAALEKSGRYDPADNDED